MGGNLLKRFDGWLLIAGKRRLQLEGGCGLDVA
jgi:hypothetical protein